MGGLSDGVNGARDLLFSPVPFCWRSWRPLARLGAILLLFSVTCGLDLCVPCVCLLPLLPFVRRFFVPSGASRTFLFCNRTGSVIEAAFGYREQTSWVSEGWWQISPGSARAFGKP